MRRSSTANNHVLLRDGVRLVRKLVLIVAMGAWLSGCGERVEVTIATAPAPVPEIRKATPAERARRPTVHQLFNATPKSEYETAVTSAMKVLVYAEALQPFCSRWFPSHGRKGAEAYLVWRERYDTAIGEIKSHSLRLWESRAGEHEAVAARVYAALRNDADRLLMDEFDVTPVKEFEQICVDLPRDILSPEWNLERKLARELAQFARAPEQAQTRLSTRTVVSR
jgi:hypothetical protein